MANSKYFRLVSGRPIADKEFDEANLPTSDQKASFPAGATSENPLIAADNANLLTTDEKAGISGATNAVTAANPVAEHEYVRAMFNQLDPQKSVTHGIDYVKAGAPTGTAAASGEKCLDTTNSKLYTFDAAWDAGTEVESGDRFCHKETGTDTGGDSGTHTKSDKIYNYDTATTYTEITPNEGFIAWFDDEDKSYRFNGTDWVGETSTQTHNNMSGKQGGTTDEFYHITSNQEAGLDASTAITASNPPQTLADRDKLPVPFKFVFRGGFAVSQTDTEVYEAAGVFQRIPMPSAGSIVKMTLSSSAARTAGTLTAEPTIDGTEVTETALNGVLDGSVANDDSAEIAPGTTNLTFSAGEKLGVKLTSDGDWAPITSDIEITLYVVFDS